MENIISFLSQLLLHCQRSKKSFYALISLLLLCLLAYNSAAIFCIHVPFPARIPPGPASFLPENVTEESRMYSSVPSSRTLPSSVLHSVREESSSIKLNSRLPLLRKNQNLVVFTNRTSMHHQKRRKQHWPHVKIPGSEDAKLFETRVTRFFRENSSDSWWHCCSRLVQPVKTRKCKSWRGFFRPKPLKFASDGIALQVGGTYIDTDVIVLKSFEGLRNVIGAQTIDLATGNWSRLNNAVMIFDQGHPLLHKFIEEFALTFDGNKWGHNGPYLVSRVVSRLSWKPGYNFTVLPPMAFYPVDWSKIGSLFKAPQSLNHSKWLTAKLRQIQSQSFALHLWNKQSRQLKVEHGSIIESIMFSSRVIRHQSSLQTSDDRMRIQKV
ncbi:UNVERIFIED_CONTAM: hypothetical protein Sradi_2206700 [Sesamum radiatum]|uniref:Alpha 1,4-glycosyltransferase domain-containing protein n=1 Tax=Sesamum radiatum TaxID=300843 RepID=A0AAW2T1W7_SESRA